MRSWIHLRPGSSIGIGTRLLGLDGREWVVVEVDYEAQHAVAEPENDEGPLEAAPHRTMHPTISPPEGPSSEPQDA